VQGLGEWIEGPDSHPHDLAICAGGTDRTIGIASRPFPWKGRISTTAPARSHGELQPAQNTESVSETGCRTSCVEKK
jgi:hypothetical protein